MRQFFGWVLKHWGFCAFVILAFVQITPGIRVNPLGWLGDVVFGGLRRQMAEMAEAIDENEKDRIRWEVLDFANSCRNGRRHTKDEFQHIIDLNDKYKVLLAKTGDKNGVFDAEYEYIKDLYAERQRKNDFL